MTTPQRASGTAGRIVGLAAATVAVAGLAGALVGLLAVGPAAALGAVLATVLVIAFFAFGTLNLMMLLRALPGAAVPLALLTYAFQVVVVGLVAVLVKRSGAVGETIDATWLGVGVIALTVVWVGAHVTAVAKARIPAYDVPSRPAGSVPAEARSRVPGDVW